MHEEGYTVRTHVFEGPLDLLLTLVLERRLSVNEISLAAIADEYITHLRELGSIPSSQTADFLRVASTLLLIKSKTLIPTLELTQEEETDIEELENRLATYNRIIELSGHIEKRYRGRSSFFSSGRPDRVVFFAPGESLSATRLAKELQSLIETIPQQKELPEAYIDTIVTLEEKIQSLLGRISHTREISFDEAAGVSLQTAGSRQRKVHIIVTFLAVLELAKDELLTARQAHNFDTITLERRHE